MKSVLRGSLVVGITTLIVGCKLAVLVIEGGEVHSERSGTCIASNICVVEITDTGFSETFRAVPSESWYFHKWNSGDRFFCGGSPDPECMLSFEGVENDPAIADLVTSSEVFFLMPVFKQTPPEVIVPEDQPVRSDGKEWLQPKHFVNYSYDQIKEACPDGMCTGNLPASTIDLTGYFWASSKDVQSLFNLYQHQGKNLLDEFIYTLAERDDELDQAVNLNLRVILSDVPSSEGWLYVAGVYDGQPFEPSKEERGIGLSPFFTASSSGSDLGAWFWRML